MARDLLGPAAQRFWVGYRDTLDAGVGWALLAGLLAVGLTLRRLSAPRSPALRRLERVGLVAALVAAVVLSLERASLMDDAFISFRYARNFAEGHGLVFNPGERVEGYTNFLWTVLIGIGVRLGGAAEYLGLWGAILAFAANVWVVHLLARALSSRTHAEVTLPIAAWLVALQYSMNSFGTTGLETGFTSLLVNLGVLSLVRMRGPRDALWAGLFLILSVLSRPDHAVFYAVGAWVVVSHCWASTAAAGASPGIPARIRALATERSVRAHALCYAAPFVLYLAHQGFRLAYYGDFFPNTYYAKSASQPYYSQGLTYAAFFYLGSHLWLLLPTLVAWAILRARSAPERRFKQFAIAAMLLYDFYVVRVGGDFMYGRFFVSVVPLLLLAAVSLPERLLASPRGGTRVLGAIAMMAACTTAAARSPIPPGAVRSYVVDERTYYPLSQLSPPIVDHRNFRAGKLLGRLRRAGWSPRVATSGVGMLGYYSQLEVIDLVGLVDVHVAHQPLERRGRPGHEKWADEAYIRKRAPHFVRGPYMPERYRKHCRIAFEGSLSRSRWFIFRYDRALMAAIRELEPGVRFDDFERYLDRYIRTDAKRRDDHNLRKDIGFFREYYFDLNDDPGRLRQLEAILARRDGRSGGRARQNEAR